MTLSRTLVILGAGGHGRVVASAAQAAGWGDIAFMDPGYPENRSTGEWQVEADGRSLAAIGNRTAIVAIGDNATRMAEIARCQAESIGLGVLVHPSAWVCDSVRPGDGTVVLAQAAVNYGAKIGRGVIVNTGAVVEHDCLLGDCVHVSPGAVLAGGVQAGRCAWIGAGAIVRQGVLIGEGAVVGMGSVVISDVPAHTTWVGVPARALVR